MGPKYEFTDETMTYYGSILHRIKRLSDGKIGGFIEKEENLLQDGNCWVDNNAMVYGDAKVYGNAYVYDDAKVGGHAKVYGNAKVYNHAWVFNNAKVYNDAEIYMNAEIYGNAEVYGNAKIFGDAEIYGNVRVYSIIKIDSGEYYSGEYYEEDSKEDTTKEVVQDFIYKVDDSNKLTAQTEYDSIDEFFNEPITNDIKLDTLVICSIDTKESLIKLQKVETEDKTEFKFIVDIINEDGDDFRFRSIIKSQEQLNQLIQQTIEALKNYHKFNKYIEDLENCL